MKVRASSAAGADAASHGASDARALPQGGPIDLGGAPRTVDLRWAPEVSEQRLTAASTEGNVYLALDDVSAAAPPGTTVDVYIDPPKSPTEKDKADHYAGTLNFFDAVPMDGMQHGGRTVLLNITRVVGRRSSGFDRAKPLTVTFEPDGAAAKGSEPMIMGRVEIRNE